MDKLPTSDHEAEAVAVEVLNETEELAPLANGKDLEEDGHASNVEDILDKIGFGYFQWKMLFLCAFGYFAVCTEMLITVLISDLLLDEFHISRYTFAWLPFSTTLASLFGSMIWGYISDLYGRQIRECQSVPQRSRCRLWICVGRLTCIHGAFTPHAHASPFRFSLHCDDCHRGCWRLRLGICTHVPNTDSVEGHHIIRHRRHHVC